MRNHVNLLGEKLLDLIVVFHKIPVAEDVA